MITQNIPLELLILLAKNACVFSKSSFLFAQARSWLEMPFTLTASPQHTHSRLSFEACPRFLARGMTAILDVYKLGKPYLQTSSLRELAQVSRKSR